MTFPKVNDEQRAAAFNRGNHFRRIGEFDKALAVYERIVAEDEQDAEAHWCCALCRFGIEYVEDPATYEWLPTCHRASFDSFLEDVDYKAALEYSDGVTRRQYMKEGTKIAEVQRGILATSQNADPFDVFICYKESDEQGNRTRDSLLAQEIYYQLTEQGRKVFFARITLESMAGTQYEPYIFAALNSAKIMVVVGTSAANLNAVWVKNEWSRFLAMMKHDHGKILLPCYRDMDPYDLPEQLSVLQSYDMAKIGFIQDLTRGIAKVLDAEVKPTVKETVVVQQNVASNADALLKRGIMALEDCDWQGADKFFEEVLNQNAECAQAYLGKALIQERVTSLEALTRKHVNMYRECKPVRRFITPKKEHIDRMVSEHVVPGYLADQVLRDKYENFDLGYPSFIANRAKQHRAETQYWEQNKLLNRAVQFAKGDSAKDLEQAKKTVMDQFAQWMEAAKTHEAQAKAKTEERYEKFLAEVDAWAAEQKTAAEERRETVYQSWVQIAENEHRIPRLREAEAAFMSMNGYSNSAAMVEYCRRCIEEEQTILDAAEARRRMLEAERIKAKNQAEKRRGIIALCIIAGVILAIVLLTQVIIPAVRYNQAEGYLENGQYIEAMEAFEAMDDRKDAPEAAEYARAKYLMECARNRDPLGKAYLDEDRDSGDNTVAEEMPVPEAEMEDPYAIDEDILAEYDEAYLTELFAILADIIDDNYSEEAWAEVVEIGEADEHMAQMFDSTWPEDHVKCLTALYLNSGGDITVAWAMKNGTYVEEGAITIDLSLTEEEKMAEEFYDAAYEILRKLGSYRDAKALADTAKVEKAAITTDKLAAAYAEAEASLEAGDYEKAAAYFAALGDYMDSAAMVEETNQKRLRSIYDAAAALRDAGNPADAYTVFLSLDDYEDSAKQALQCAAQAAADAEAAQAWESARAWYLICNDTEGRYRAQYGYIKKNYESTNKNTFAYLKELIAANFQDAQQLYDTLYEQKFTVVVNKSRTDTTTNMSSVDVKSDYDDIYVHVLYTGGTPDQETVNVKLTIEYLENGKWGRWSSRSSDTMTNGTWCYHSFCTVGRRTFRAVLKNTDTNEVIMTVPINVY
ncbi:MAG: TIR domain-containing protein [Oscillospiraceae bacterium]|nr:TIR domain-containing protein [Oscillospiraceae bacterium]